MKPLFLLIIVLLSFNNYSQLELEFSMQSTPKHAKQFFGKWRGAISKQNDHFKATIFSCYTKSHFTYSDYYRYGYHNSGGANIYQSYSSSYTYTGTSVIEFLELGLDLCYVFKLENFEYALGPTFNIRKTNHIKDYDEIRTFKESSGWSNPTGSESSSNSGAGYSDLEMFTIVPEKLTIGVSNQANFYIKDFFVSINIRLLFNAKYVVPKPRWENQDHGNYIDYKKFLDLECGLGIGYRINKRKN